MLVHPAHVTKKCDTLRDRWKFLMEVIFKTLKSHHLKSFKSFFTIKSPAQLISIFSLKKCHEEKFFSHSNISIRYQVEAMGFNHFM